MIFSALYAIGQVLTINLKDFLKKLKKKKKNYFSLNILFRKGNEHSFTAHSQYFINNYKPSLYPSLKHPSSIRNCIFVFHS